MSVAELEGAHRRMHDSGWMRRICRTVSVMVLETDQSIAYKAPIIFTLTLFFRYRVGHLLNKEQVIGVKQ